MGERRRDFEDRRDRDEAGRRRNPDDYDLNESKTLWMGDINIEWDERDIEEIFKDCGEKVVSKHPIDPNSRPPGPAKYCFVEFETRERAEHFLEEWNGKKIPGSKLVFKLNIRYPRGPEMMPRGRRDSQGARPLQGRMGDRERDRDRDGGRRGSPEYGSRSPARRDRPSGGTVRDRDSGPGRGRSPGERMRDGSTSPARWNPSESESRSGSESPSRSGSKGRAPRKDDGPDGPAKKRLRTSNASDHPFGRRDGAERRPPLAPRDTDDARDRDRRRDSGGMDRSRSPDAQVRRRPRDFDPVNPRDNPRASSRERTSGRGERDGSRSRNKNLDDDGDMSDAGSTSKRKIKREATPPATEQVKYIRVTLSPGSRMGELPPGIPLMKVLNDYMNRWRQEQKNAVVAPEDQHYLSVRPIVGALVNGRACPAGSRTSDYMHSLSPIFIDSFEGHAIYRRSVVFLAALACSIELATYRAVVQHVAREGVVLDLVAAGEPPLSCDLAHAEKVERGMKQLAKLDLPITSVELAHRRALTWFTIGSDSKHTNSHTSKLIRSRHDPLVPCYKCCVPQADFEPHEFFALDFGPLTSTTGLIEGFSVELAGNSLLVRFGVERPTRAPPRAAGGWQPVETPLVKKSALWLAVKENSKWKELHGLGCTAAINVLAAHSTTLMKERVALSEGLHEMKIHDLASTIALRGVRVVLLAGPVGGGSEAVLRRLNIALSVRGLRPMTLPTAEFALPDPNTDISGADVLPTDAAATGLVINSAELAKAIGILMGEGGGAAEEAVVTLAGTRVRRTNGVLIIHGPHAFKQDIIGDAIRGLASEQIYRIYVEPISQLNVDDLLRVSSNKVRMLCVIAQEHTLRQASARKSIQKFYSMQAVDEVHLYPYQDTADIVFNSSLPYDVPILKPFVAPLLRSIPPDSPDYCTAQNLTTFLGFFESFSPEMLPDSSILREYISKA